MDGVFVSVNQSHRDSHAGDMLPAFYFLAPYSELPLLTSPSPSSIRLQSNLTLHYLGSDPSSDDYNLSLRKQPYCPVSKFWGHSPIATCTRHWQYRSEEDVKQVVVQVQARGWCHPQGKRGPNGRGRDKEIEGKGAWRRYVHVETSRVYQISQWSYLASIWILKSKVKVRVGSGST